VSYRIIAGTGLFARALLAHPDWSERTVIRPLKAYDPSFGMQTVFVERTTDDCVTVAEGKFDRVNAEDNWADLIVIAQVSPLLDHSWEPKVEYWS